MLIELPYGTESLSCEVPEGNITAILEPPQLPSLKDPFGAIEHVLRNPLGARPISCRARPGTRVSIAISDASRPNIERWILPIVFRELEMAGVKDEDITVIVGTGSHRPSTPEEIAGMVGEKVGRVKIINHSADTSPVVNLGRTSEGFPALVNRLFLEADLKIALGTVLPHPLAGYSGGGKAIAVGLASSQTVGSIHAPAVLDDPRTGLGKVEDNPLIRFGYEVSRLCGLDLLINAVVNEREELVDVACGDVELTHQTLIKRSARRAFEVSFHRPADIVIVSAGHPKDNNLYHVAAEALGIVAGPGVRYPCVKEGGTIIVVSPMAEGIYSKTMFELLSQAPPHEVVEKLKESREHRPGTHRAYATAKILCKYEVIFAGSLLDPDIIRRIHARPVETVEEALRYALAKHGPEASIMIVKNSHRLVPVMLP